MITALMEGPITVTKTDPDGTESTDWKQTILSYSARQGPIFVLLAGVLAFLAYCVVYVVPTHLETINKGYEKNAATLKDSVQILVDSHEKDRQLFEKMMLERRGDK